LRRRFFNGKNKKTSKDAYKFPVSVFFCTEIGKIAIYRSLTFYPQGAQSLRGKKSKQKKAAAKKIFYGLLLKEAIEQLL